MQPDVEKRILDAINACQLIEEFTGGCDYQHFSESALLRSAVERQFEIVGEALNRASHDDTSLGHRIPEIPKVIGLRNRLIHGYDAVDDQLIWDIVQTKIIPLHEALEALLADE